MRARWICLVMVAVLVPVAAALLLINWRAGEEREAEAKAEREGMVSRYAERSARLTVVETEIKMRMKNITHWRASDVPDANALAMKAVDEKAELELERVRLKVEVADLVTRLNAAR